MSIDHADILVQALTSISIKGGSTNPIPPRGPCARDFEIRTLFPLGCVLARSRRPRDRQRIVSSGSRKADSS